MGDQTGPAQHANPDGFRNIFAERVARDALADAADAGTRRGREIVSMLLAELVAEAPDDSAGYRPRRVWPLARIAVVAALVGWLAAPGVIGDELFLLSDRPTALSTTSTAVSPFAPQSVVNGGDTDTTGRPPAEGATSVSPSDQTTDQPPDPPAPTVTAEIPAAAPEQAPEPTPAGPAVADGAPSAPAPPPAPTGIEAQTALPAPTPPEAPPPLPSAPAVPPAPTGVEAQITLPAPTPPEAPPPLLPTHDATAAPSPAATEPSASAAAGLLLVVKSDDTLRSMYTAVYKGLQAPPFEAVAAMNPRVIKPGGIVTFPAPPGGWQPLPDTDRR